MRVEQLHPKSRLLHDLGMDGDDAVDFFSGLENQFRTEFVPLYERWGDHFGGEHLTFVGFVGIALTVLMGFAAAEITSVGHPLLWALVIGAVWLFGFQGWPLRGPSKIPITVEEVIASVEGGTWVKRYDEPIVRRRAGILWGVRPKH